MTRTAPTSRTLAASLATAAALAGLLFGCNAPPPHMADAPAPSRAVAPPPQPAPTPTVAAPAPTPPPILPFDQAVLNAARAVFKSAPPPGQAPGLVVIDPLVDGMTGYQSNATQDIGARIQNLVRSDYPQYAVQKITSAGLRQQPRVLVGTFTPVDAQMKTVGEREAYRFCLVMGDLATGKIVAKGVARAAFAQVDATPTAPYRDGPVWTQDPSIEAYIATCQASKVGDPIKPEYVDGLLTAALVSEAGEAYSAGRYADALDLYNTARRTPAGDQLRVYNGIYLADWKLGRPEQANAAFRDLVDYGLRKNRLAVKFLFQPGSVRFLTTGDVSGSYGAWLKDIAEAAATRNACIEIDGHTSKTGPAVLNERLSLLRAEYIQTRLESEAPQLKNRTVAYGLGARQNLIGTGRDDLSDALDRRVELKPIASCA